MGNGKFRKGREGRGERKPDAGACGTAGRPTSRETRTKQATRDVASGKKLTLETIIRGKKLNSSLGI